MTDTDNQPADDPEVGQSAPPADDANSPDSERLEDAPDDEPETFPREVVEGLRKENGKYRQRAQRGDAYARRLHHELVKGTGRLADPSDLEFDESHLDDPEALAAAVDELLTRKPHLASRKPVGDIGQGNRGGSSQPFNLLQMLKDRT